MLVCAGPGDKHERMTVNALRYGQMMAKGATGTKGVKGQKGAKRVGSRAGAVGTAGRAGRAEGAEGAEGMTVEDGRDEEQGGQ